MAIRLLLIQLSISLFWLLFMVGNIAPITLPLVAAFAFLPLVGVLSSAKVSPLKVIPILVLFSVGYLAWLYGWAPSGPTFAWITGLGFLVAWNGCTQAADQARMRTLWLGVALYCPLFIMAGADAIGVRSGWAPALGIAIQSGALVYAIRSGWPVTTAITDITILRLNGLAMLMLPIIFITDNNALFGTNEHILGLGGAASAIVMTRQHLRFRRRLLAANQELADYTYRDQLTGLLTWAGLKAHLDTHPMPDVTMVCVDLDAFGHVNAEQGFDRGDELLIHIGKALNDALPDAIHARIGGDFFVAVVGEGTPDPDVFEAAYAEIIHAFDQELNGVVTAGVSARGPSDDLEGFLGQCDKQIAERRAARLAIAA